MRDPVLAAGPYKADISHKLQRIRRWMVVRMIMLVGLSMGAVAGVAALALRNVPGLVDLVDAFRLASRIGGALASLFSIGFLLANRTLGQLEMDTLLLVQLTQAEKPRKGK